MRAEYRWTAFVWATIIAVIDQASKLVARHNLMQGIPENVLGEVLRFTLRYNFGAAFSLGWGGPVFLSIFTGLACIFLVRYMFKIEAGSRTVWLGVILGGAAGNLIDRLMMGKVTDFIDVGFSGWRWPTFNVADIAICIGGIAVFFLFRRSGRLEVSSEEKQ